MKPSFDSVSVGTQVLRLLPLCALLGQITTAWGLVPVVGLWRFNEGSGTNVTDSSGFNNNGFLVGENGNMPVWATGQAGFGGALRFTNDGLNHAYVSIPGSASLQIGMTPTNAWTMTAWAYEDSNGTGASVANYGRIIVTDDGTAFQWESGSSLDEEMYTWSRANTEWQFGWTPGSPVAPLLDQWVHWAVVYDGTNLTVYRNGNQGAEGGIASQAVVAALSYAGYAGSVLIGSEEDQTADRTWNGLLDDVAVFAGALSEAQIQTVMSGDFSAFLGGPVNILTQPQSQTVDRGATVNFQVVAQGISPVSYQWFFNGTTPLAGETTSSLTLADVQVGQAGIYTVTVSNSLNAKQSQPAVLIVNTNPVSLVGLWRFNDGSGTNAADSSGFNNTGVLTGENGNVPAWVPGQPGFGGALSFTNDAVDHAYVAIPGSSSLQIGLNATNPWSLTAWAYENSDGTGSFVANYGRIVVMDDGTAFQLESGAVGDAQMYTWSRANPGWQIGWQVGSPVSPLLDQWVHWAVVYDGTNLVLYRDGNQGPNGGVATNAVTAALGYAGFTGALHIGSEAGTTADRNWNGMLDDVALFKVALSQDQVRTVMSGDFSSFVTRPPLFISQSQGNVVLSWTAMLPGYQLQASASLSPPTWTNIGGAVQQGPLLSVTQPSGAGTKYFRLVVH
jgi:hypothetical protein